MNFQIRYHKKVYKFLEKCDKTVAQRFLHATEILQEDPYTNTLDIKRLQGKEKGSFRIRIGKYRFKYTIIEHEILIYFYDADSRGDIY